MKKFMFTEDAVQYGIRKQQEQETQEAICKAHNCLVVLNMINKDAFGDRRTKKQIRLEKELAKYLGIKATT